jgi:hypothetical protein
MDKYLRFMKNLAKGDKGSARNRRRLMERELKKLKAHDRPRADAVDSESEG